MGRAGAAGATDFNSLMSPPQGLEVRRPSLADRALCTLRTWFAAHGHNPSPEGWNALRALLDTLGEMADGTAKPRIFGSFLPTGAGKTSAIAAFLQELVNDPAYCGVGAVVLVNELVQIEELIKAAGLEPHQYAVRAEGKVQRRPDGTWEGHKLNYAGLTGLRRDQYEAETAEGYGKRGKPPLTFGKAAIAGAHHDAQVLFITQQKLEHILRASKASKDYRKMAFLRYGDQPRQVRIWDEAIAPGAPVTVTEKQVRAFTTSLALRGQQEAADVLTDWVTGELCGAPSGSVVTMPIWGWYMTGEALDDQDYDAESLAGPLAELERTMWWLEGREVRVQRTYKTTLLTYRPGLPHNFGPLLVCDASGALSETYKLWPEIHELKPSAPKLYRNLTIHHWDHSASRSAFRHADRLAPLADAVCDVLAKTEGDVLVIYRKHDSEVRGNGRYKRVRDIRPVIEAKCAERGLDFGRLKFLHWGAHRASNDFRSCEHFIIFGANLLPPELYEAMVRAAMALTSEDVAPERAIRRMREGDVKQHWLQAAGRSAIRIANGDDCPPGCTGWIIYSTSSNQSLPRDLLRETFPGATVVGWQPDSADVRPSRKWSPQWEPFMDALIQRFGDRESMTFERKDLAELGFSETRLHWFLSPTRDLELTQRELARRGYVLTVEQGKREGRRRYDLYTLRRAEPQRKAA